MSFDRPPVSVALAPASRVGPFYPNPNVQRRPWWMYGPLFLFWCVAIPLRAVLYLVIALLLWVSCRLLLIGAKQPTQPGDVSFSRWRSACVQYVVCFFLQALLVVAGFWVTTDIQPDADGKKKRDVSLSSGIIVSNHVGYYDALVIAARFGCSVVSKDEIHKFPLLGVMGDALQNIWVRRSDASDRERVRVMILERAQRPECRSLLLFPEGTNANGTVVLQFRKGVFEGGQTVQPLAIRSRFRYFDPTQTCGSLVRHGLQLLFLNVYHHVELTILTPHVPTEAEKSNAILFAHNVQTRVAAAAQLPCSELTMEDNPHLASYFAHARKKKAAAAAAIESHVCEKVEHIAESQAEPHIAVANALLDGVDNASSFDTQAFDTV